MVEKAKLKLLGVSESRTVKWIPHVNRLEITVELANNVEEGKSIEGTTHYGIEITIHEIVIRRKKCPNYRYFRGPGFDVHLLDRRDEYCRDGCMGYGCSRGEIIEIGRLSGRLETK